MAQAAIHLSDWMIDFSDFCNYLLYLFFKHIRYAFNICLGCRHDSFDKVFTRRNIFYQSHRLSHHHGRVIDIAGFPCHQH